MKQIVYFLLLVCFNLSCSKSDDQSNTDLLVNKKWKISGIGTKSPNGIISDDYASLSSYQKDAIYLFKPDFTFTNFNYSDLVPGSDRQVNFEGTWSLSNADTYINITVTVQGIPSTTFAPQKISELSTRTLSWEVTDNSTGTIYYHTFTVIP